jgi:hypothetical protein
VLFVEDREESCFSLKYVFFHNVIESGGEDKERWAGMVWGAGGCS